MKCAYEKNMTIAYFLQLAILHQGTEAEFNCSSIYTFAKHALICVTEYFLNLVLTKLEG